MSSFITIFTPTYNRCEYLKKLYVNLKTQRNQNFEWLVVDDGSCDGTKDFFESIKQHSPFRINYYYKKNGGKHTAINFGLNKANSDIFFLLDSDDYLHDSATEILVEKWKLIENDPKVCGIVGLSKFINNDVITHCFPKNDWVVSFTDIYFKYKIIGDKPVAFKTSLLKKFPFPEHPEINFVFEAVVWHEMAKFYDVLATNEFIQYKVYLEEGISKNTYQYSYLKSLAFSYYQLITNRTYPLTKYPSKFFWNYIHLGINSMLSKTNFFKQLRSIDKVLYIIALPRSYYTYKKLKKNLTCSQNINS